MVMFTERISKICKKSNITFIRHKNSPDHWSAVRKKNHATDKALNYFDEFYKQFFGEKWEFIRKALFRKQKYVTVVNNFGGDEGTKSNLELKGALNMRTLLKLEKTYLKQNESKKMSRDFFYLDAELEDALKLENETLDEVKDMSHLSIEKSLSSADYDTKRFIDPKIGLSSEILAEYIPATKLKGKEDFISESTQYKLCDKNKDFNVIKENEYDIHFPEHLNVYCFEKGNYSNFDSPRRSPTGVLNYYLMDGASILPVLALDLRPGHKILDMCAAPGGKSLLALQTFYPDCIVSNDVSLSRLNRIQSVYNQFVYDFKENWLDTGKIKLSNQDGRNITHDNFDRILVDVPCTNDRLSLHENDNNIFKPSRIKERLQLPELQRELLFSALNLVKIGGVVVYSTCSLSPIQNDGVVHMTLKQVWEETDMEIIVKDLTPALLQTRSIFELSTRKLVRYGHLVIPSVLQNYGPTYFCKLQRIN